MNTIRFIPPPLRAGYLTLRGIPFTKGYDKSFDKDYEKKSKDYIKYQSVKKDKIRIESDIRMEKGLAMKTREREQELVRMFKEEKYSFESPGIFLNPYGMTPLCAYLFFYTENECSVRFCVEGRTKDTCITDWVKRPCKWHRIPVYGLYPGKENKVFLELVDTDGKVIDKNQVRIETAPLKKVMEDAVRIEQKKAESAMKLIFVAGKSTTYPMAFDTNGDIRYLMMYRPRGYGFFELANGRFIMMERQTLVPTYMIPHSTQMYEIGIWAWS